MGSHVGAEPDVYNTPKGALHDAFYFGSIVIRLKIRALAVTAYLSADSKAPATAICAPLIIRTFAPKPLRRLPYNPPRFPHRIRTHALLRHHFRSQQGRAEERGRPVPTRRSPTASTSRAPTRASSRTSCSSRVYADDDFKLKQVMDVFQRQVRQARRRRARARSQGRREDQRQQGEAVGRGEERHRAGDSEAHRQADQGRQAQGAGVASRATRCASPAPRRTTCRRRFSWCKASVEGDPAAVRQFPGLTPA